MDQAYYNLKRSYFYRNLIKVDPHPRKMFYYFSFTDQVGQIKFRLESVRLV